MTYIHSGRNPRNDICTKCGRSGCDLTVIDDETAVCEECLDAYFFLCDECGQYWEDTVTQHWLKDGSCICDNCIEDIDPEEIDESF